LIVLDFGAISVWSGVSLPVLLLLLGLLLAEEIDELCPSVVPLLDSVALFFLESRRA